MFNPTVDDIVSGFSKIVRKLEKLVDSNIEIIERSDEVIADLQKNNALKQAENNRALQIKNKINSLLAL